MSSALRGWRSFVQSCVFPSYYGGTLNLWACTLAREKPLSWRGKQHSPHSISYTSVGNNNDITINAWSIILTQTISFPPSLFNRVLACRIVTDQAIGTPVMIALVFLGNAILTGESPADVVKSFKTNFIATWMKGAQFWPLCHYLGTYRLELMYQPLFAHIASMYWNGVLSIAANKSKQE